MGLDLFVREQTEFRTDDKGRSCWTVTNLVNLRNCWKTLDFFSWETEQGISNCSTHSFFEGQFFGLLNALQEQLDNATDTVSKHQLEYEVNCIKDFIKQENLQEQEQAEDEDEEDGRTFEIHAWW